MSHSQPSGEPSPLPPEIILVAGMHRSGTSAFAGMLHLLGFRMGSELLPPKKGENDKGFWEHKRIVEIHERLLNSHGLAWDSVRGLPDGWMDTAEAREAAGHLEDCVRSDFADAPAWALKDPRLCRIIPLWRKLLADRGVSDPLFVLVIRHPWEVSRSLKTRDGFSSVHSSLLWLRHLLEAERDTRGCRRVFVPYDAFLNDPVGLMERLTESLDIRAPKPVALAAASLRKFLTPELRHHHHPKGEQDEQMPAATREAFAVARRATLTDGLAFSTEFDALRARLEDAADLFLRIRAEGGVRNELALVRVRQENARVLQRLEKRIEEISELKRKLKEERAVARRRKHELEEMEKFRNSILRRLFDWRKSGPEAS